MIEIYTKPTCPYCVDAKALLDKKGQVYREYDIAKKPELRAEMMQRAGGRTTVPQIFIDNRHIGGCDDLMDLQQQGKLDALLKN
ncbi:MAG: glutaredoxin 3 [Francisellaceae bacterium]